MTVLRSPRRIALLSATVTVGLGGALVVLMTAGGETAYATPTDVLPTSAPAPVPTVDPTAQLPSTTDVPLPLSSPSPSPTDTSAPAGTTPDTSADAASNATTTPDSSSDGAASASVTTSGGTSSGAQASTSKAATTGQAAGNVVSSTGQQTTQKVGDVVGAAPKSAPAAHLPSITKPSTIAAAIGMAHAQFLAPPGLTPAFLPPLLGQANLGTAVAPLLAPPATSGQSLTTGAGAGSTAAAQLAASHSSTPGGAPVIMAGLCGLVALGVTWVNRIRRRAIARMR